MTNNHLAGRRAEAFDQLRRCNDTFGKMLLTGRIKRIDREIEEARSRATQPERDENV